MCIWYLQYRLCFDLAEKQANSGAKKVHAENSTFEILGFPGGFGNF